MMAMIIAKTVKDIGTTPSVACQKNRNKLAYIVCLNKILWKEPFHSNVHQMNFLS
jgi:hypothetical protein